MIPTLVGRPAVFHDDLPAGGTDRVVQTFELKTRVDFRKSTVAVLLQGAGIEGVEAGGQDDIAHLDLDFFIHHAVIDGLAFTDPDTFAAFGTDPAVEAARGLPEAIRFGQSQGCFGKGAARFGGIPMNQVGTVSGGNAGGDFSPVVPGRSFLGQLLGIGLQVFPVEEPVYGFRRPVPRRHGVNDRSRTAHRITAGKYVRQNGLQGVGIDRKGPHSPHLEPAVGGPVGVDLLTDGGNDHIAGYDEFRVGHRHRSASATLIGRPQFGADALEAAHSAIRRHHPHRSGQIMDDHPFRQGTFDFLGIGGHFLAAASINHAHLVTTQPQGGSGRIDGHVAAADHDHLVARRLMLSPDSPAGEIRPHPPPRPHRRTRRCQASTPGERRFRETPPGTRHGPNPQG